jgi:regulator of replication initiation timing
MKKEIEKSMEQLKKQLNSKEFRESMEKLKDVDMNKVKEEMNRVKIETDKSRQELQKELQKMKEETKSKNSAITLFGLGIGRDGFVYI